MTEENDARLQALKALVRARAVPGLLFAVRGEPIAVGHLLRVRELLGDREFDQLDLVVDSGGGDIHVAYQIAQLLHLHAKSITAIVPLYAKSAATLLCLGVDKVIMSQLAELGPLDTQIVEIAPGGRPHYTSALNPFKTLEQIQQLALETLDIAMKMILSRSMLDIDGALKHGVSMASVITTPLLNQIKVEQLGEYSRDLEVGEEYGFRLLKRYSRWNDDGKIKAFLAKLIRGYPSHEYIIDCAELKDMGFPVELSCDTVDKALQALTEAIIASGDTRIELLDPEAPQPEKDAVAGTPEVGNCSRG